MSGDSSEKLKSQYLLYITTVSYLTSLILCGTGFNIVALVTAFKVGDISPIQWKMSPNFFTTVNSIKVKITEKTRATFRDQKRNKIWLWQIHCYVSFLHRLSQFHLTSSGSQQMVYIWAPWFAPFLLLSTQCLVRLIKVF